MLPGSVEWRDLAPKFVIYPGVRQIILGEIDRVQTSCGFAVPYMDYVGERDTLLRWAETKGEDGVIEYQHTKNLRSQDGLPTPLASCVVDV